MTDASPKALNKGGILEGKSFQSQFRLQLNVLSPILTTRHNRNLGHCIAPRHLMKLLSLCLGYHISEF